MKNEVSYKVILLDTVQTSYTPIASPIVEQLEMSFIAGGYAKTVWSIWQVL